VEEITAMGKVIAFMNMKGGVSKTSSSLLLSYGLKSRGFKILLIDMDSQRNLSRAVGAETNNVPTTMELLLGEVSAEKSIQHLESFDIIPSRKELASIEPLLPLSGRLKKLKKSLDSVKNNYDYVVVDTPPNLGVLSVNSLVAADQVIIPTVGSAFSIEGLVDLLRVISDVQEDENPDLVIAGVLISIFNPRTNLARDLAVSINDLSDKYGIKTYSSKIRQSTFIPESQLFKFDPFVEDPKNIAVIDFNKFIDEFLGGK